MASEKDICIYALQHIGQFATLRSLDDDSAYAQVARISYPFARDALLERHAWNFATTREQLAPLATAPAGWRFAYPVPAECLKVLSVVDKDSTTPTGAEWRLEGYQDRVSVLTDLENATITYVKKVVNTDLFSPLFTEALSWQLAAAIAGPIIKGAEGQTVTVKLMQFAAAIEQRAIQSDMSQQRTKRFDLMPDWLAPSSCKNKVSRRDAASYEPTPMGDRGEFER